MCWLARLTGNCPARAAGGSVPTRGATRRARPPGAAVEPLCHLVERQPFQVSQDDHVAVGRRQAGQLVGHDGGLFALLGLGAGRMPLADQSRIEVRRRLVQQVAVILQRNLAADRALLGQHLLLDGAGQVVDEDGPQPAEELLFAVAAELLEVPARLQERLLDDVGRVTAGLDVQVDLRAGEQVEVVAVQLQQRPQLLGAPLPGLRDQPLRVLPSERTHEERTLPFRKIDSAAGLLRALPPDGRFRPPTGSGRRCQICWDESGNDSRELRNCRCGGLALLTGLRGRILGAAAGGSQHAERAVGVVQAR